MDDRAIFEELLALLEQNNVPVRTEAMGGRGTGLCKFKDKKIFFVDSEGWPADMARICALAVNEILDIDDIYIKPQIRQFIEHVR